jgi:hypothetical protein
MYIQADNQGVSNEAHSMNSKNELSDDDDEDDSKSNYQKTTKILSQWFLKHIQHPYITKLENQELCNLTGWSKKQVQNWFTNIRKRKY